VSFTVLFTALVVLYADISELAGFALGLDGHRALTCSCCLDRLCDNYSYWKGEPTSKEV
jgi:hypothetical protein